jgi:uncharacterized protein (TIGR03118 family)
MNKTRFGLPRRRHPTVVANHRSRLLSTSALVLTLAVAAFTARPAKAQNAFVESNLVSNIPGLAAATDTNLINPWGLAFSATSPFWVSDAGTGLSTVYTGAGVIESLVVTIPPPAGQSNPAAPTGIIANSAAGFLGSGTATAHFIFSTEDGTLSAWSSGSAAVLKVDYSAYHAVFKGLASGASGGSNFIYASDFHNSQVDVFNSNYAQVTLAGSFTDASLPAGYAPFGIQNINGQIFVTYALQDSSSNNDLGGPGNGFVDIFDTSGNLLRRFISQGVLNSPWGVAVAPVGFGPFAGDVLVGNFRDGRINAFDPQSGEWLGALEDANGLTISVIGLWAIAFGNGHDNASPQNLYFTAGINGQSGGLLGSFAALYPSARTGVAYAQSNLVSNIPGLAANTDTNLVNPWGIAISATSPFWVSDAGTGLSTVYTGAGTVESLVVTVPAGAGQTGPSAPTGIIANTAAGFLGSGAATAHFIFSTENGTISAWSGGGAAALKVDYSTSNAVFKGLAAGSSGGSNFIYASDFHNAQVDVFNSNYAQVTLAGSFTDTNLPAGYAPFGIQNINGQIFVTYALQDSSSNNDLGGPGHGYVDIFSTSGVLVQQFIAQSVLNSPWGVALAPVGFGAYGGDILVGNFRDGRINVFNPASGAWLGALMNNTNGGPFEVPGLWAIIFGNGHSGGDVHTLYFTAGINGQSDGLLGSLAAVSPTFSSITSAASSITLNWAGGGTGPFAVQQSTNLAGSNWATIATTTNSSFTISNTDASAFFRLINQGE